MRNKKVLFITQASVIAAIYVIMTLLIQAFNLASGMIQIRISEVLCILPVFTKAAIPGLGIGCFLANLLTPNLLVYDVVFGSLATFLGALGTYLLRHHKVLGTLPPVIANMVIIPFILRYGYGYRFVIDNIDFSLAFFALTVGVGEAISVCGLGGILLSVLKKYRNSLFRQE